MGKDKQKRARSKQIATLLTAYGLGFLGAGLFDPLTKGAKLNLISLGEVIAGMALHSASVYFAARAANRDGKEDP